MGLKENIKKRRLELNLTLETVAKKLFITKPTLQRYESGVISNIPSDKIEKLAEILDTTPAALMGWNISSVPSFSLTDKEQDLLKKYRKLDNIGKHTIDTIISVEYDRCK